MSAHSVSSTRTVSIPPRNSVGQHPYVCDNVVTLAYIPRFSGPTLDPLEVLFDVCETPGFRFVLIGVCWRFLIFLATFSFMLDREVTAMLDCEDGEKQENSNCKHCQGGGDTNQQQRYWDIPLDPDLLETIVKIYPDWFKDYNMNVAAEGRDSKNSMCLLSSPDAKANGESLQNTIDKNKESLKVKLMLRRPPLNQLVDQGILPPLKSPPAFHEQRQKLERTKMGDILKQKFQKRPDRQELIQQHVLEDSCLDSSLQDRQKQLKKARLADSLNAMISPRPLEFVKGNIFHAEEILAQAVRENFKTTCNTPSPKVRTTLEDDSGSDGAFSPSPPYEFSEHSQSSLPSLEASELSPTPNQGSPCSGGTSFSMSPPSSVSSPPVVEQIAEYLVLPLKDAPTPQCKNRKKSKPKTQPKTKQMKFHEYKGPPNAQKPATVTTSSSMTESYECPLNPQQHQLLIQLQLECEQQTHAQNSSRQFSTVQRPTGDQPVQTIIQKVNTTNQTQQQNHQSQQQQLFESPNSPQKLLSNFEDLKVTDLKAVLKKKGLPVSGSKPQLIQRLRSHVPQSSPLPNAGLSIPAGDELSADALKSILNSIAPGVLGAPHALEADADASIANDHIVQLQQLWIEQLQREVERSREQLRECQLPAVAPPAVVSPKPPAPTLPQKASNTLRGEGTPSAESKAAQKQIIQQLLQQKIQQQELQKAQRQQGNVTTSSSSTPSSNANSTLTALLESGPLNAPPMEMDLTKVDLDLPKPTFSAQDAKVEVDSDFGAMESTSDDYPGVIPIYICHTPADNPQKPTDHLTPPNAITNRSSSLPSFSALRPSKPSPTRSNTDPQFQITRPPPNYSEATRQLKVKQHHLMGDGNPRLSKKHKSSIKSQAVDDVLEILISNGELSPSAAQEPITPITPTTGSSVDPPAALPLFATPSGGEPFFPKPLPAMKTAPKEVPDLHLASLQSVLDLTPPPSTGFADAAPSNALDFDFPLDMPDIDALELEGLDHHPSTGLEPVVGKQTMDFVMGGKSAEMASHLMRTIEMADLQDRTTDRGMDDNDIIEWLEDFEETSGHSSSTNFPHSTTYGITNDNDPLFSNGHDTLDFFTGDDMDFKPQHDFTFLPWGENTT